jgi:hypothetical protein
MRLAIVLLFMATWGWAQQMDWSKVEKALARKGTEQNGVFKVSCPRTDLHVTMNGTPVQAGAALGSWMAFRREAGTTVADGDLVLTPNEITPVVRALRNGNITVSAIHNHLAGEQPEIMYVHFFASGDAHKIAATLRDALDRTQTPPAPAAPLAPTTAKSFADEAVIEGVLGKKGAVHGTVLAFSFPGEHAISMRGKTLQPAMGMATAINFQPAKAGVAATGDFVVQEAQTQALLSALANGNVQITAMHNHLLEDEPRMVFIHFWAEGPARQVATTLRSALDAIVH